jgi:hypothetical protein
MPNSFRMPLGDGDASLQIDRPQGEAYCNYTLFSAHGSVVCYLSGYAASPLNLVASPAPYLQIGNACVPLPADVDALKSLASFLNLHFDPALLVP